jgi:hypothetical protein
MDWVWLPLAPNPKFLGFLLFPVAMTFLDFFPGFFHSSVAAPGGVAQRPERRLVKPRDRGSIPLTPGGEVE